MADYVDCYPKRPLFRAWVADAKAKLGARSNAEVAEKVLKVQRTTLNKWLGKSPTHKPNPEALKTLGDFLGRDYRELMDDPDAVPAWSDQALWEKASPEAKTRARDIATSFLLAPEPLQGIYHDLFSKWPGLHKALLDEEAEKERKKP